MTQINKARLVYLPVIAIINIYLAYTFGSSGIETYYITAIVLLIIFIWLNFRLGLWIYKSNWLLLFKIVINLALAFFCLIGIATIISTTSVSLRNPQIDFPEINKTLVLLGILPYLIPKIGLYINEANPKKLGVGLVSCFYSILVVFVAFMAFNDNTASLRNIVLVIAVQLQLIMNFIVTQTNYVFWARQAVIKFCNKKGIVSANAQSYLIIASVGLPIILPVLIILGLFI